MPSPRLLLVSLSFSFWFIFFPFASHFLFAFFLSFFLSSSFFPPLPLSLPRVNQLLYLSVTNAVHTSVQTADVEIIICLMYLPPKWTAQLTMCLFLFFCFSFFFLLPQQLSVLADLFKNGFMGMEHYSSFYCALNGLPSSSHSLTLL